MSCVDIDLEAKEAASGLGAVGIKVEVLVGVGVPSSDHVAIEEDGI